MLEAAPGKTDYCQLCQREMAELTKHHVIPRAIHQRKWVKRQFDRNTRLFSILWLCRPCHSAIHRYISEPELARNYQNIDALLAHPEVKGFVEWIKTKPTGFKPKS